VTVPYRSRAAIMLDYLRKALTGMGVLAARPIAFLVVLIYSALWLAFSPQTLDWPAMVALATWMMTVIIQRAEYRDTQAIHAKLDHLLERIERADTSLAGLDKMQPEEIEQFREDAATP
jgi:low affinity Fe/Cu permease